ncbi:MAG: peptidylprolyl isomerase [Bacteroidetes bacterium]|nr:peptidylprolyl isomerase [Bacteroidota bacterium]
MKMRQAIIFLVFISIVVSSGCKKDQLELDREKIEDYLNENNLQAESLPSGLHYIIEEPGIGDNFPDINSEVEVRYSGSLLDGRVFDSTDGNETVKFFLYQVIAGWQEGIPLFKKEGKGTLIIPSHLAYGSSPPFGSIISANAVLVFDIELVDF